MHTSFRPLVNGPSKASDPAPSEDVRDLARRLGSARTSTDPLVFLQVPQLERRLRCIALHARTDEDRTAADRALHPA